MESELIKDADGNVIGEIREEGGDFGIWRREKPSFPPKSRYTLLGSGRSLEEARKLADELFGCSG